VRVPTQGPNGGVADSLDEAKAAFRAAWAFGKFVSLPRRA
jgi:hypothetical protein